MDFGTRSIVGIVCYLDNDKLHVLASEVIFHPQRDMLSGQIQNIAGVAETALKVKTKLEKRLGIRLEKVCIAAAGRALKTRRYLLEKELAGTQRISQEEIDSLELEAVEKSRESLYDDENNDNNSAETDPYYCVGYTTVNYYLDSYPITNLIGQKGNKMGIEVLATFLPQVVIDSLLTVIEKLGLTVHNLTLEPIAALHIIIPPEYRTLNLALVDVGAGTSDIAITHKGSVIAYAMVPHAGDEISEYIAEKYLLDFNTAESVKLSLSHKKANTAFHDILGNSYNLSHVEIIASLEPAVESLAAEIASTIIKYNNGAPRAVFLIGGGSLTPLLREKLAGKLELPLEMLAIRGKEIAPNIIYLGKKLKGPESITPFGIAASALQKDYYGFSYLTVNDKVIRLIDTENLKVGNVLIAAGFTSQKMLGRRAPGIRILLNGTEKYYPGNAGESAIIRVNGEKASLEATVKNNDKIEIEEAKDGLPKKIRILDLLPSEDHIIVIDDISYPLPLSISLNGKKTPEETVLSNGDKLEWRFETLQNILTQNSLESKSMHWKINGAEAEAEQRLKPGDRITSRLLQDPASEKKEEGVKNPQVIAEKTEKIGVGQETLVLNINGETVFIPGDPEPSFAIIFDYINFDLGRPQGKQGKLVMIHNGKPASLAGKLSHGDVITIHWE